MTQPLPADVTVTAAALGAVPTAKITIDGIEPRHVVLYFHGGVYVLGDAFSAADLASQVGRRTRAKVISVDYRLAPEHPYPAAVDDALAAYEALLQNGTAPSDIAFAGESAGGGLAVATLVNARDHGLPLPAAAFVMSPYADLTLAGICRIIAGGQPCGPHSTTRHSAGEGAAAIVLLSRPLLLRAFGAHRFRCEPKPGTSGK